jgi:alkylated DNA repair protein (DNA oxidative demethylase)
VAFYAFGGYNVRVNSQLSLDCLAEPPGLPPGFVFRPKFLTEAEHDALLAEVESWEFGDVKMRGVVARRSVRHFGFTYNFDTNELVERNRWPFALDWLRVRAAELAGVHVDDLQQVLVTKYPVGAPIGWHRDAPTFGNEVIGVSLRSTCRMRFRKGRIGDWQTAEIELPPCSAYVIGGQARWVWQHHIPPAKSLRYSVTFRTLRDVKR